VPSDDANSGSMGYDEPRSLRAVAGPAGSVGERLTDAAIRHRVSTGKLVRLARGAYVDPRLEWSPQRDLLAVALASPDVVFSHFTALQLLGASGLSADIWVSIGHKDRPPSAGDVPIQIVRCLPGALVEGVGAQRVENLDIRVTTAARTVVDFFKSRNKLGLDVAVHALIAVRRSALASVDDIWLEAQRHKMCGEIGPYLRAVGGQA
jgi:predicted transcriptional regulator of viral defense system